MHAPKHRRLNQPVIIGILLFAALSPLHAATLYVSTTGNNASDGLTWPTAKQTVQAALDTAASGDQVWVATGTYVQCITLKSGVALYGGFAGTETDLGERNWTANPTILDGNKAGSVVFAPKGATQTTRIDGFTIRNGRATYPAYCGGVYCELSSPAITHNTITANSNAGIWCSESSPLIANNTITSNGGGIYCVSASPIISHNTIAGNSGFDGGAGGILCLGSLAVIVNNTITNNSASPAGGGIYCQGSYGSPTIANNTITGNSATSRGGGICCDSSTPVLANNTITGNSAPDGGGVYCISSTPAITNTIIAFNSSGLCGGGGLRSCCVYGNAEYNYASMTDPTGQNGNTSIDPRLANAPYGNVHLQSGSPCVDAGNDSRVVAGWPDIDDQPRIGGSHVDIGADEADGTIWPSGPNIIVRVSPAGNDANDGSSWLLARQTVQAGIDAAAASGGEVWVQEGTYLERITLRNYVHVYGGFAGVETQRPTRNWSSHVTVLDGNQGGSVVTVGNQPGYALCTIDGFTIRGGSASSGGGIYCYRSSPTIRHDRITGNSAVSGAGIYCSYSCATIAESTITRNIAASDGGGIYYTYPASLHIVSNEITGNSASSGGGIYCADYARIVNNTITGNSADNGGGIYSACSGALIANDTITGNSASTNGGGLYDSTPGYAPFIVNTILAFNSSGIYSAGNGSPGYGACVYANTAYNFSGPTDPTGTRGNISADPRFVRQPTPGPDTVWGTPDDDYGDLRLLPGSPCIDAAYNWFAPADTADLDADGNTAEPLPWDLAGVARFLDDPATPDTGTGPAPIVDIGAYEYLCGDINADGHVNIIDLLYFADSWAKTATQPGFDPRCDLNADGAVDVLDLLSLAETFGK